MSDTIAAIATGAVRSAIGIIRLSGDGAIPAAAAVFRPADGRALSSHSSRRLILGSLLSADGAVIDNCLCTISRAPNSYTGEDTAELQCHGSPVMLTVALNALFAAGARQAGPGEFTRRAFLNGKLDLTGAEAVMDLIDAETASAVKNAAGQLGGAILRKADGVYEELMRILSHYHAVVDWPDEGVEEFEMEKYAAVLGGCRDELSALLATYGRGQVLRSGLPVVIAGRPNVGKSSLFNALLGYDRAIVTAIPGTTRDTVEEKLVLGSAVVRLIDTAGLRQAGDEAERLGVIRSREAMDSAGAIIAVADGSRPLDGEDMEAIKAAKEAALGIIVLSKADLGQYPDVAAIDPGDTPVVSLSCKTGQGMEALCGILEKMVVDAAGQDGAGQMLTNARQAGEVRRALESVRAAAEAMAEGATPDIILTECEEAMEAISALTGRSVREDIVDDIFSRFCVGK